MDPTNPLPLTLALAALLAAGTARGEHARTVCTPVSVWQQLPAAAPAEPDPLEVAQAADDWQELYDRLAPFAGWFPADAHEDAADAHFGWCRGQKELQADRAWWHDHTREAARRYEAWRLLRLAGDPNYCAAFRLAFLDQLESIIGPDGTRAGLMPTPVPGQRWSGE